jgi:RimJ/RimL family protein N-acetyltransferase
VQFAFEVVEVEEIASFHAVWNEASGRILEKNGFQFVKHLPQGFQKRGEWVAEKQYLLTKERWQCLQESQS